MKHHYRPKNTCSTHITFDLEGNVVRNVEFTGGCSGNLQGIQRLVEGSTVQEIEEKLGGILCGSRRTSCADQLCKAVREAYGGLRG
jgi:uncharacterized protein (TIGR03905 family)